MILGNGGEGRERDRDRVILGNGGEGREQRQTVILGNRDRVILGNGGEGRGEKERESERQRETE